MRRVGGRKGGWEGEREVGGCVVFCGEIRFRCKRMDVF